MYTHIIIIIVQDALAVSRFLAAIQSAGHYVKPFRARRWVICRTPYLERFPPIPKDPTETAYFGSLN